MQEADLGLQDTRVCSLALLPFWCYKPKLTLYTLSYINWKVLPRTWKALFTTNGVIRCCLVVSSVHFTQSDLVFNQIGCEKGG